MGAPSLCAAFVHICTRESKSSDAPLESAIVALLAIAMEPTTLDAVGRRPEWSVFEPVS